MKTKNNTTKSLTKPFLKKSIKKGQKGYKFHKNKTLRRNVKQLNKKGGGEYGLLDWISYDKLIPSGLARNKNPKVLSLLEINKTKFDIVDWTFLCTQSFAFPFIIENFGKENLPMLSANPNPNAIKYFRENPENIDWEYLSQNSSDEALALLGQYPEEINWSNLSSNDNDNAIKLLEINPNEIDWQSLSTNINPGAIRLLEENPEKIDWINLSANISAINLLEQNPDKIDWNLLSENPFAIEMLKENPEKINWKHFSKNPEAIEMLKRNPEKIDWKYLSENPRIFKDRRDRPDIEDIQDIKREKKEYQSHRPPPGFESPIKEMEITTELIFEMFKKNVSFYKNLESLIIDLNSVNDDDNDEDNDEDDNKKIDLKSIVLPSKLVRLEIISTKINGLPFLPNGLKTLVISNCNLSEFSTIHESLLNLPISLVALNLFENNLDDSQIPSLRYLVQLNDLNIGQNKLNQITEFPPNLRELYIVNNQKTTENDLILENLPASLKILEITGCQFKQFPNLPDTIEELLCGYNGFKIIKRLPSQLIRFRCDESQLTEIQEFPSLLKEFNASNNKLKELPPFPLTLKFITIYNNFIFALPTLHEGIQSIDCNNNNLSFLPLLPQSLKMLDISSNPICSLYEMANVPVNMNNLSEYIQKIRAQQMDTESLPVQINCGEGNFNCKTVNDFIEGEMDISEVDANNVIFYVKNSIPTSIPKVILGKMYVYGELFYNCPKEQFTAVPISQTNSPQAYVNIQLTQGNFLVPSFDVEQLIKSVHQTWYIVDKSKKFKYITSRNSVYSSPNNADISLNGTPINIVSADHCQAGSEKKMYGLIPITNL